MVLGTVEKMAEDLQKGVLDFTKDGQCSQCGECCSDFLPLSDMEIAQIHAYVKRHGITEHRNCPPTVIPTVDYTCPFRNNAEKKCEIYPVRPAICRDFRCDKPGKNIPAKRQMYGKKMTIIRMRNEFFGKKERT